MDWSKMITEIREHRELSDYKIAKQLNFKIRNQENKVTQNKVWRWRHGKGRPSFEVGKRIDSMYRAVLQDKDTPPWE